MDPYIKAQILNAQAMAKNFDQACKQAAVQNDEKISKEEQRLIKRVHTITNRFINDLDKLS